MAVYLAYRFNDNGPTFADMTVMAMDQLHSHHPCLYKIREDMKVDQDPGDLISFRNKPQGEFSQKPA